MAVYRVERTQGYTVMSNYHLKDTALSLKAKGLLSMFLSFPEDWNYSTRGLAAICKEGVDAIGSTIKELEKAGNIIGAFLASHYAMGWGVKFVRIFTIVVVVVCLADLVGWLSMADGVNWLLSKF